MIDQTPFALFEKYETNSKTGHARKRFLKFDINALADFEQETGMGFGQLMSTKAVFATTRAMLWAGMKHEDRGLSVEEVGRLLGIYVKEGGTIDVALKAAFESAAEQGALGKEISDRMADGETVVTDPPQDRKVLPGPVPVVAE
jgi:hypothetical protein